MVGLVVARLLAEVQREGLGGGLAGGSGSMVVARLALEDMLSRCRS